MIGAPNTRGQKYWVGIVQWAPATSVSEEIADIFTYYNIDTVIGFTIRVLITLIEPSTGNELTKKSCIICRGTYDIVHWQKDVR